MSTNILHHVSSHAIKNGAIQQVRNGDTSYLPYLQDNVNVHVFKPCVASTRRMRLRTPRKRFFRRKKFLSFSLDRVNGLHVDVKFVLSRSKNDSNSMHLLQPVAVVVLGVENKKICALLKCHQKGLFPVLLPLEINLRQHNGLRIIYTHVSTVYIHISYSKTFLGIVKSCFYFEMRNEKRL